MAEGTRCLQVIINDPKLCYKYIHVVIAQVEGICGLLNAILDLFITCMDPLIYIMTSMIQFYSNNYKGQAHDIVPLGPINQSLQN